MPRKKTITKNKVKSLMDQWKKDINQVNDNPEENEIIANRIEEILMESATGEIVEELETKKEQEEEQKQLENHGYRSDCIAPTIKNESNDITVQEHLKQVKQKGVYVHSRAMSSKSDKRGI